MFMIFLLYLKFDTTYPSLHQYASFSTPPSICFSVSVSLFFSIYLYPYLCIILFDLFYPYYPYVVFCYVTPYVHHIP